MCPTPSPTACHTHTHTHTHTHQGERRRGVRMATSRQTRPWPGQTRPGRTHVQERTEAHVVENPVGQLDARIVGREHPVHQDGPAVRGRREGAARQRLVQADGLDARRNHLVANLAPHVVAHFHLSRQCALVLALLLSEDALGSLGGHEDQVVRRQCEGRVGLFFFVQPGQ